MVAYLVRRYLSPLLLAPLLVYTLVMYFPFPSSPSTVPHPGPTSERMLDELIRMVGLDKPWPLSYLSWLFDTENTTRVTYDLQGTRHISTKGINLFGIVQGSGALTGDLGESIWIYPRAPVADMYGRGWGAFILLMVMLVLGAMFVVSRQRRGRPAAYRAKPLIDPVDYPTHQVWRGA